MLPHCIISYVQLKTPTISMCNNISFSFLLAFWFFIPQIGLGNTITVEANHLYSDSLCLESEKYTRSLKGSEVADTPANRTFPLLSLELIGQWLLPLLSSNSFTKSWVAPGDEDNDGIPDAADLDDDNDGIPDEEECSSINFQAVYHLFDPNWFATGNNVDVWLQIDGLGSNYINISNGNPGASGQATNVTDDIGNLAYDDGNWYFLRAGDLWQSADLIESGGTFVNLGATGLGPTVNNLAFDNGVFYYLFNNAGVVQLYSSTNPVGGGWTLVANTSLSPSQMDGLAVDDGVFYAMDSNGGVAYTQRAYSTTNPAQPGPWPDVTPSTFNGLSFGDNVTNLAIGSADVDTYCDADNDGVPNHLDLDSDNDGIYDLVEAGHSEVDANTDGIIDGPASNFGANGLYDGVETFAESNVLNYTIADSESTPDGIYDAYELDADGDTCFDAEEESVADGDSDGIAGTGVPTVDADGLVSTHSYAAIVNNTWQNSVVGSCLTEICDNGIDDDGDGLVDCADSSCDCCEAKAPTLSNL